MRKINLIFALLLSLMGVTQISAQQALPYEYGFEDYNLAADGWTTTNTSGLNSGEFGIAGTAKKTGDYGFRFSSYSSRGENTQYLISPELNAPNGVVVSFSYAASDTYTKGEKFKVGYSTTDTDVASFTWDEEYAPTSKSWAEYEHTFPPGTKYIAVYYYANYQYRLYVDDFSFEAVEVINGPALKVFDGGNAVESGYSYNFGLAAAGQEKTFTLSNPGTEDCDVTVAVKDDGDNFGVSTASASIPAGGEVTLTVTMPDDTTYGDKSGEVTITPSAAGLDPIAITVVGTLRDPNKVYLDFADGTMPDGWTSVAIGQYVSSTYGNWTAHVGYICEDGSSTTYASAFTSPKLTFEEGEQILFETAKFAESAYYKPSLTVEYSLDGSTWTAIGSSMTDDIYGTWTQRGVIIPVEGVKYIRFKGYYVNMRNIYGGELPMEPKMVVTQPESLNFGIITAATTKTFTIANTGRVELTGINVASSNAAFTISGAPASLAAGASQEVTITMSAETTGALSSEITVSATNMEVVKFTVTGVVMPADAFVIDFNDNALPAGWTNGGWTFTNGYAATNSRNYLTSPVLSFADTNYFVFKVKASDSGYGDEITVQGSSDKGSSWSNLKTFTYNNGDFGSYSSDFTTVVVSGIPSNINKIRFYGYYVCIDDIAGLIYAPVLTVTQGNDVVSTPANYDFGETGSDAIVTYNFANTGAGTINITAVEATGIYTTNFTEAVGVTNEAPFNLVITQPYDVQNVGEQNGTVTVTTSEGVFVINVTGIIAGADDPHMGITPTEAAAFGKVRTAPEAKTYTITNTRTGTLTGTIVSSAPKQFTVSESEFSLAAGESMTFNIALAFNFGTDTDFGAKAATITVSSNDGEEPTTIEATAFVADPNAWTEDFDSGSTLPAGWETSEWTVGTNSDFTAINETNMALAPTGRTTATLTTPRLEAKAGDILTWDAYFRWNDGDARMTVEYSNDDKSTWNTVYNAYQPGDDGITGNYASTQMSFTAPANGYYYLRFTANYKDGLDNFEGFKLALKDHDMSIKNSIITTTGTQFVEYSSRIKLTEAAGKDETVTVKFFIGENEMASEEVTVDAGSTTDWIYLTFTPQEAVSGDAYFTVTNDNINLESAKVNVTIAAATILDETTGIDELPSGSQPCVVLNYQAKQGWNTIGVPFGLTDDDMTTLFGEGWKAYELSGFTNGALTFREAIKYSGVYSAGYPFIVYCETPGANELKKTNVSLTSAKNDSYSGATFQTTYAPMAAGTLTGKYGVVPSTGRIQKAGSGATMKGFRGYFTLPTTSANVSAMFYDADGIITAIEGISIEDGQLNLNGAVDYSKPVYNLSGQRVGREYKGVVIQNGKKIVVK